MLGLTLIAAMVITSCKNENKDAEKTETVAMAEYQCPMKCEGDKTYTDKDAKCPVCGMGLKEVAHGEDHHDHEE